jgi:hypothetical protein
MSCQVQWSNPSGLDNEEVVKTTLHLEDMGYSMQGNKKTRAAIVMLTKPLRDRSRQLNSSSFSHSEITIAYIITSCILALSPFAVEFSGTLYLYSLINAHDFMVQIFGWWVYHPVTMYNHHYRFVYEPATIYPHNNLSIGL